MHKPPHPPTQRPVRIRVLNQFGKRQSLDGSLKNFAPLPGGDGLLLLGLGPNPAALSKSIKEYSPVSYLEAPKFERQMPASWLQEIPRHWQKISPTELRNVDIIRRKTLFYQPNLRLFPDFWGPVLAAKNMVDIPAPRAQGRKTAWMPLAGKGLLGQELTHALSKAGLDVFTLPDDLSYATLLELLRDQCPDLFLCVNFQGLDAFGQNFAVLEHLNIPVAVWCVDNPFHLLPALKSTFWQRCMLFVTDDWFIKPLREHGAKHVFHLPLAADPDHFQPRGLIEQPDLDERIVFVGRSSFPDKDSFFSGCSVSDDLMGQAVEGLTQGRRPDFSWWWGQFGHARLWPGSNVRRIGFAAEQCSQHWRIISLKEAARTGRLTVYGDKGWQSLLPAQVELRPAVDYYGPLADIYSQARYTLNLTSLLLPHGLTQRHFDVWVVGGFLLTDTTPGLEIFDQELVRETAFACLDQLPQIINRLERDPPLAGQLCAAWRKHILAKHTYDHRVATVLDCTGL